MPVRWARVWWRASSAPRDAVRSARGDDPAEGGGPLQRDGEVALEDAREDLRRRAVQLARAGRLGDAGHRVVDVGEPDARRRSRGWPPRGCAAPTRAGRRAATGRRAGCARGGAAHRSATVDRPSSSTRSTSRAVTVRVVGGAAGVPRGRPRSGGRPRSPASGRTLPPNASMRGRHIMAGRRGVCGRHSSRPSCRMRVRRGSCARDATARPVLARAGRLSAAGLRLERGRSARTACGLVEVAGRCSPASRARVSRSLRWAPVIGSSPVTQSLGSLDGRRPDRLWTALGPAARAADRPALRRPVTPLAQVRPGCSSPASRLLGVSG